MQSAIYTSYGPFSWVGVHIRLPQGSLLQEDYRNLRGRYTKIVNIEMFEAVGLRYYHEFFRACGRLPHWIHKYIFRGSELASVSEILRSLARATSLGLYHAEEIGTHYARFIRMWDYYLAYCEGAFLERHIGDFQLRRTKNHSSATLFSEPWREDRGPLDSAAIQEPVHLGAGQ